MFLVTRAYLFTSVLSVFATHTVQAAQDDDTQPRSSIFSPIPRYVKAPQNEHARLQSNAITLQTTQDTPFPSCGLKRRFSDNALLAGVVDSMSESEDSQDTLSHAPTLGAVPIEEMPSQIDAQTQSSKSKRHYGVHDIEYPSHRRPDEVSDAKIGASDADFASSDDSDGPYSEGTRFTPHHQDERALDVIESDSQSSSKDDENDVHEPSSDASDTLVYGPPIKRCRPRAWQQEFLIKNSFSLKKPLARVTYNDHEFFVSGNDATLSHDSESEEYVPCAQSPVHKRHLRSEDVAQSAAEEDHSLEDTLARQATPPFYASSEEDAQAHRFEDALNQKDVQSALSKRPATVSIAKDEKGRIVLEPSDSYITQDIDAEEFDAEDSATDDTVVLTSSGEEMDLCQEKSDSSLEEGIPFYVRNVIRK